MLIIPRLDEERLVWGDVVRPEDVFVCTHERALSISSVAVVDDEDVVATWVARQGMTRQALHVSSDVLIWKPLLEGPVPPRSVGQYSLAVGSRVCGWVRQQCGV